MAEYSGMRFNDARLRSLKNIGSIHSLALYDTAVTDAGIELLRTATRLQEIHITSDHITDESMSVLCSLPSLVSLLIARGRRITDDGVKNVANAPGLRELYLSGTQVSDQGLQYLSGLSQLWSLILDDTAVGDEGVRLLNRLPKLALLGLNRARVSGAGLVGLANNDHFGLYLAGAPVNDEGVRSFAASLTNLKNLDLSGTRVTDASADSLSRLPKLNVLRLADTQISDLTLAALCGRPKLEAIYLRGTHVTDEGVRAMKKANRRLAVYLE